MSKEKIIRANVYDLAEHSMKLHGANVNILRTIADLRDGLKVGQRRVLYTMFKNCHLDNKTPHIKVANILGQCMAKYHPHVEAISPLLTLSQWWSSTIPAIDGQGGFGSVFGDKASASRYIEARFSDYGYDCFFSEWFDGIVDMRLNYDGKEYEPEYLPSKYPNLIINGAVSGMGYGFSSNIPLNNFNEVIDLTLKIMKNPDYKDCFLIPDSPTGCYVTLEDYKDIYNVGEGGYKMRAHMEVTDKNNILITNIAFKTESNKIYDNIVDLIKEGKIDGIGNIEDDSNERNGIRIHIIVKKGFDPYKMMDILYKKTQLQENYNVNFNIVYDYKLYPYNLRRYLLDWIDFRRETKRRAVSYNLFRSKRKMDSIDALLKILMKDKSLDRVITIVKKSKNKNDCMELLITEFGINDMQAETISEMKLHQLSRNNDSFQKEYDELSIQFNKYSKIFKSDSMIDEIIVDELIEGKKRYGTKRRSKILDMTNNNIPNTNHIIIFTKKGFLKKLPDDFNGVGKLENDDYVLEMIKVNNRESIMVFDKHGKVFSLPVHEIRETDSDKYGVSITNYIQAGEIVTVMDRMSDIDIEKEVEPLYLVFASKKGLIKKSLLKHYSSAMTNGLIALKLRPEDELVSVKLIKGDEDIIIYTKNGKGVKFNTDEIRETLRTSMGDVGIKLELEEDSVTGMSIIDLNSKFMFMLTSKGHGKKCILNSFSSIKRGDKGMNLINLEDEDDYLIHAKSVRGNESISVYTEDGIQTIYMKDVPELTRMTKGKKLLRRGRIIDIIH